MPDAGEGREIVFHIFRRLTDGDIQIPGKSEGADPVDDPEVHGLCLPAQLRRHLFKGNVEDLGGGRPVNIQIFPEGIDQHRVLRHMRKDPQLDLGIIRIREKETFPWHEDAPQKPALLGPGGDILKIRIRRGDPPGGRDRLMKMGVDPAILSDKAIEPVRIGALQLGEPPVFQKPCHHGIVRCKLFQDLRRRGIAGLRLLRAGQLHLPEEDLAQLLCGIQIAVFSQLLMQHFLKLSYSLRKLFPIGLQLFLLHLNACLLHPVKQQRKRHFHFQKELFHPQLRESLHQRIRSQKHRGGRVEKIALHCLPVLPVGLQGKLLFKQLIIGDHLDIRIFPGHIIHAVIIFQRIHQIGSQQQIPVLIRRGSIQKTVKPFGLGADQQLPRLKKRVDPIPQKLPRCLFPQGDDEHLRGIRAEDGQRLRQFPVEEEGKIFFAIYFCKIVFQFLRIGDRPERSFPIADRILRRLIKTLKGAAQAQTLAEGVGLRGEQRSGIRKRGLFLIKLHLSVCFDPGKGEA